jgi:DNA-binding helix-hairpin-helix protein with protein kinase domain
MSAPSAAPFNNPAVPRARVDHVKVKAVEGVAGAVPAAKVAVVPVVKAAAAVRAASVAPPQPPLLALKISFPQAIRLPTVLAASGNASPAGSRL